MMRAWSDQTDRHPALNHAASIPPLPQRLRTATQALHTRAERSGVMGRLLEGRLSHARYVAMMLNLRALYGALEPALRRHAGLSWLQGIDGVALSREAAIAADLHAQETDGLAVVPATQAYVDRLRALDHAQDPALLAHVYTRYLGDLHGGQVLRTVVSRAYPGQGTAFYEFGPREHVERLRGQLRLALASVALTEGQFGRVVDEACWSFEQHRRMFEELDAAA